MEKEKMKIIGIAVVAGLLVTLGSYVIEIESIIGYEHPLYRIGEVLPMIYPGYTAVYDPFSHGFPFQYAGDSFISFNIIAFLIDFVIWFAVAGIIVWFILRKKPLKKVKKIE